MTTFLLFLAAMVGIALSRGYVLSVLWAWFIVPGFSVPAIGLVTALGISLISVMLVSHPSGYQKPAADLNKAKAKEIAFDKITESLMFPWAVLVMAWLILKIAALVVG